MPHTSGMELNMRYATTADRVRIAYAVAGKGLPVIRAPFGVFSHCQLEWRQSDFFDRLTRSRMVIPFDPRGSGLSDRDVDDLSLQACMLDIDAVAGAAGVERFALHGVGASGPLVISYAAQHPERISHLILDDIFIRGRKSQVVALRGLADDWISLTETMAFMSLGVGGAEATRYAEYLRACTTPEIVAKWFAVQKDIDVTDLLPHIQAPTLLIQHQGVPRRSLADVQEAAKSIPDARLAIIEGKQGTVDPVLAAMGDFLGDETPRSAAASPAAPGGLRTILFTDLVGHTEMMQRLGDERGRAVLREHERITRDLLRQHGGAEVKTMGDGFMASFASVTAAMECAIALQRAISSVQLPDSSLQIRVGLNAGEPIEEDGDLFGATVILASRIAAKADAGEILVPDTVRGLLSGKGFVFGDRGEFIPRGFDEGVRLWDVRWQE